MRLPSATCRAAVPARLASSRASIGAFLKPGKSESSPRYGCFAGEFVFLAGGRGVKTFLIRTPPIMDLASVRRHPRRPGPLLRFAKLNLVFRLDIKIRTNTFILRSRPPPHHPSALLMRSK